MAIEEETENLLFARVKSLLLLPAHPVAWPNVAFTQPANNRWLRVFHIPGNKRLINLQSTNRKSDILQIDLVSPLRSGSNKNLSKMIIEHFFGGLVIHGSSFKIRIITAKVEQGIESTTHFTVPHSILYDVIGKDL